jgi:hypothetical protein
VIYSEKWQDSVSYPIKKDSFMLYFQIVKGIPINFIFIADEQNIYSKSYSYLYAFYNHDNKVEVIGMGGAEGTDSFNLIFSDSIIVSIDSTVFIVKAFEEPSFDMLDRGGTLYINKDLGVIAGESISRGFSIVEKNSMINDSIYRQIRNKVFEYISKKRK